MDSGNSQAFPVTGFIGKFISLVVNPRWGRKHEVTSLPTYLYGLRHSILEHGRRASVIPRHRSQSILSARPPPVLALRRALRWVMVLLPPGQGASHKSWITGEQEAH